MTDRTNVISEHIGCRIFASVGVPAQETILGKYGEHLVVACKDFRRDNENFYSFLAVKNSILETAYAGSTRDLEDIILSIRIFDQQNFCPLMERFWDMFIIDTLIGNFDRHNGNWGILVDDRKNFRLAPVFDCGSSLSPRITEAGMQLALQSKKDLYQCVSINPKTPFQLQETRLNPQVFLRITEIPECLAAIQRIIPRIDLQKINAIIDETPYMTDVHRRFLKKVLAHRKADILDPALARL